MNTLYSVFVVSRICVGRISERLRIESAATKTSFRQWTRHPPKTRRFSSACCRQNIQRHARKGSGIGAWRECPARPECADALASHGSRSHRTSTESPTDACIRLRLSECPTCMSQHARSSCVVQTTACSIFLHGEE